MAMIPCGICSEKGTVSQGRACPVCGGAGEVEAPDGFHMSEAHKIAMYRMLLDTNEKLDVLQEDMGIIKTQIAALYEDLNP